MKQRRFSQIRWGEAFVFLLIFVIGIVIFVFQFLTWAIPQFILYQEFIPSQGIVVRSKITEKNIGMETLYRPEVLLEHSVLGTDYRVWTFDYFTLQYDEGYTPSKELAEASLKPFVDGQKVPCWYRINVPSHAVVVWQTPIWGWFLLLLSFSLIVIGMMGLPQSFRWNIVSKERQAAGILAQKNAKSFPDWQTIPDVREINESPGTHFAYRLPMGQRSIFSLVGQSLFAAAWTIIALIILIQSFFDTSGSTSDFIVSILFRSTFCGVGLVLYWVIARQLWMTFRIAPTLLEISDHPIYPNRKYRVLLHQNGTLRFQHLTMDLVCEEIARFHQGTDTVTNRLDVFRQTVFSRSDFSTTPELPLHEEFFIQLPRGSMHSFRQKNNEIAWKLEFAANLTGRSEIRRDCPIVVRPGLFNDLTMEGNGL